MWNCTHFRHPTDERLQNSDMFRSHIHLKPVPFEYKRQYKFTCLQKRDKLLKYKCKVNVYQEHNTDILCYKFIFNQNINCQMPQKNLLLLVFFFKKKRFFNKFAINTVYTLNMLTIYYGGFKGTSINQTFFFDNLSSSSSSRWSSSSSSSSRMS